MDRQCRRVKPIRLEITAFVCKLCRHTMAEVEFENLVLTVNFLFIEDFVSMWRPSGIVGSGAVLSNNLSQSTTIGIHKVDGALILLILKKWK